MDELEVKRDAPRSDLYLSGLTETLTDELGVGEGKEKRRKAEEVHPRARLLSCPGRGR